MERSPQYLDCLQVLAWSFGCEELKVTTKGSITVQVVVEQTRRLRNLSVQDHSKGRLERCNVPRVHLGGKVQKVKVVVVDRDVVIVQVSTAGRDSRRVELFGVHLGPVECVAYDSAGVLRVLGRCTSAIRDRGPVHRVERGFAQFPCTRHTKSISTFEQAHDRAKVIKRSVSADPHLFVVVVCQESVLLLAIHSPVDESVHRAHHDVIHELHTFSKRLFVAHACCGAEQQTLVL
mmetsp:Transcript_18489/g.32793  ORF Transcript_18489/g.32793 Transcript_18489/m.32793 type:complete len:234 (-) Transcript_18489:10-711(-)